MACGSVEDMLTSDVEEPAVSEFSALLDSLASQLASTTINCDGQHPPEPTNNYVNDSSNSSSATALIQQHDNSIQQQHTTSSSPATKNMSTQTSVAGPTTTNIIDTMSPGTAKMKCHHFLSTLIQISKNSRECVAMLIKNLVQGLIDGVVVPEDFINHLKTKLNASPQPSLVMFLKKSLPYLRYALGTKELSIEGVRPPSLSDYLSLKLVIRSALAVGPPHITPVAPQVQLTQRANLGQPHDHAQQQPPFVHSTPYQATGAINMQRASVMELAALIQSYRQAGIEGPMLLNPDLAGDSRMAKIRNGLVNLMYARRKSMQGPTIHRYYRPRFNPMGQPITSQPMPATAQKMCQSFLSTLLLISSYKPESVTTIVKNLVQDLIDDLISPEDFTNQLTRELNKPPQPNIISFLKSTLPYLRQALTTKELSIEGMRPPPINDEIQNPEIASTTPNGKQQN